MEELFLPESSTKQNRSTDALTPLAAALGMSHIGRVVAANDTRRALILLQRCNLAKQFLRVGNLSQPPRVELVNPQAFRDEYHALRARRLQEESDTMQPAAHRSQKARARIQVITRLAKLWSPLDARAMSLRCPFRSCQGSD